MARISLPVDIPDDQLPRVQAALRSRYGRIEENGEQRDMTGQELVERLRQEVIQLLKQAVQRYERKQRMSQIESSVPSLDAT